MLSGDDNLYSLFRTSAIYTRLYMYSKEPVGRQSFYLYIFGCSLEMLYRLKFAQTGLLVWGYVYIFMYSFSLFVSGSLYMMQVSAQRLFYIIFIDMCLKEMRIKKNYLNIPFRYIGTTFHSLELIFQWN